MALERANIQAMTGYTSGEQPESADVIKLNTNENPFPAGPAVEAALANLKISDLRRYPPPTAAKLRSAIANFYKLVPENIIVTNGGDELLRLAITTFVELSESIGVAEPSYSLYPVLAKAHGCHYVNFSLNDDWSLPENYGETLNKANIKLCFVVNPNAPSGYLTMQDQLEELANTFKGILVIDEAYADFIDPDLAYNTLDLVNRFDNVLILRTFSKGYSLAGLRMAFGIGCKSLIEPMQYKTKDSFNTDYIAQTLALAAFEDQNYAQQTWSYVRNQRAAMKKSFSELGFNSIESQSNFLLIDVGESYSAERIYNDLKDQGILVRFFKMAGLEDKLRITIGTEQENQKLLSTLQHILKTY